RVREGAATPKGVRLDLAELLDERSLPAGRARRWQGGRNDPPPPAQPTLDDELAAADGWRHYCEGGAPAAAARGATRQRTPGAPRPRGAARRGAPAAGGRRAALGGRPQRPAPCRAAAARRRAGGGRVLARLRRGRRARVRGPRDQRPEDAGGAGSGTDRAALR